MSWDSVWCCEPKYWHSFLFPHSYLPSSPVICRLLRCSSCQSSLFVFISRFSTIHLNTPGGKKNALLLPAPSPSMSHYPGVSLVFMSDSATDQIQFTTATKTIPVVLTLTLGLIRFHFFTERSFICSPCLSVSGWTSSCFSFLQKHALASVGLSYPSPLNTGTWVSVCMPFGMDFLLAVRLFVRPFGHYPL